jgi:hypothetical protein
VIRVEERVYERKLNAPQNGKKREGAISDGTRTLLNEWADLAEDPSAEGFVFPSERISTPLCLDNLWRAVHTAKAGEVRPRLGIFSGIAKNQRQPFEKTRCRSESCLRPERPRNRRQQGGLHNSDLEQMRVAVNKLEAAVLEERQPEKSGSVCEGALTA